MIRFKSTLGCVIIFTALLGMVIGCGASAEKQAMSDFLALYESSLNEYSAANESMKAEMKEKLVSFKSKWVNMKIEMGSEVTPQTIDKLDKKYKEITNKYASL